MVNVQIRFVYTRNGAMSDSFVSVVHTQPSIISVVRALFRLPPFIVIINAHFQGNTEMFMLRNYRADN